MASPGHTWNPSVSISGFESSAEPTVASDAADNPSVNNSSAERQESPPTQVGHSQPDFSIEPFISIRMLMTSKDVGSVIGKGGMTIKSIRDESGAKINISNGTSSERLVTVTGTKDHICKAFLAMATKIQQDNLPVRSSSDVGVTQQVSCRLIVQTSQCGSLIGKGGAKIREIRETTGASVQVAGETLPNSTERTVTISGSPEEISHCLDDICSIVLENPPKGPFIPYKPHTLPNQGYQPKPVLPYQSLYTATAGPATTTQHMRIPNDLIGCVIGRKGSKIHEIRVSSGAQIKIAGNEGDGSDRLVTITGTPEAVGMAQYLINSRIHSEVNSFLSLGMNTV